MPLSPVPNRLYLFSRFAPSFRHRTTNGETEKFQFARVTFTRHSNIDVTFIPVPNCHRSSSWKKEKEGTKKFQFARIKRIVKASSKLRRKFPSSRFVRFPNFSVRLNLSAEFPWKIYSISTISRVMLAGR